MIEQQQKVKLDIQQKKKQLSHYPKFYDTQGMLIQRVILTLSRISNIPQIGQFLYKSDSLVRIAIILYYIFNNRINNENNQILLSLIICIIIQTILIASHAFIFSPSFIYQKLNESIYQNYLEKLLNLIRILFQDDFSNFFKQSKQSHKILKNESLQNVEQDDIKRIANIFTSWFFLRRLFTALRIFIVIDNIINQDIQIGYFLLTILFWDFSIFIFINNDYYQITILHSKQQSVDIVMNIVELTFQFCQSIIFVLYLKKIQGLVFVVALLYFLSMMIMKLQIQQRGFFDAHTISLTEEIFLGSKTCLLLPLFRKDINQVEMVCFNKFNKLNIILFLIFQYSKQGLLLYTDGHMLVKCYIAHIQLWVFMINTFFMILKGSMIFLDSENYYQFAHIDNMLDVALLFNKKQPKINLITCNIGIQQPENQLISSIVNLMNKNKGYYLIKFNESLLLINQYGNIHIEIQDNSQLRLAQLVYDEIINRCKSISTNMKIDTQDAKQKKKYNFMILKNIINQNEFIHLTKKNELVNNLSQIESCQNIKVILENNNPQLMVSYIIAFQKLFSPYLYNNQSQVLYDLIEN